MNLTLCLCNPVIGSAHYLTKRNIWVKFNENRLKGSGDMEGTRNSMVNPLLLTCDRESTPAKFCSTNWRCSRTVLEHLELF